jgi:hypothetical protein
VFTIAFWPLINKCGRIQGIEYCKHILKSQRWIIDSLDHSDIGWYTIPMFCSTFPVIGSRVQMMFTISEIYYEEISQDTTSVRPYIKLQLSEFFFTTCKCSIYTPLVTLHIWSQNSTSTHILQHLDADRFTSRLISVFSSVNMVTHRLDPWSPHKERSLGYQAWRPWGALRRLTTSNQFSSKIISRKSLRFWWKWGGAPSCKKPDHRLGCLDVVALGSFLACPRYVSPITVH